MPGPKSDKIWADAIRKAVHEYHEQKGTNGKVRKIRYLNLLALNLVQVAAAGDIQAVKEIGDRLDGKPSQSMDVTHRRTVEDLTDDELIERIRQIRTEVVDGAIEAEGSEEELRPLH